MVIIAKQGLGKLIICYQTHHLNRYPPWEKKSSKNAHQTVKTQHFSTSPPRDLRLVIHVYIKAASTNLRQRNGCYLTNQVQVFLQMFILQGGLRIAK